MSEAPKKDAKKKSLKDAAAEASADAAQSKETAAEAKPEPAADKSKAAKDEPATDAPKPRLDEAIQLALAAAGTAVDSAQEIQRLRGEVSSLIAKNRRNNMILFYATLLILTVAGVGVFGALVFYKRSLNEFEMMAKTNRDGLLAFVGEINALTATSKQMTETSKSTMQALASVSAGAEELKKQMQALQISQNAMSAKVTLAANTDKTINAIKQSVDDLQSAQKNLASKVQEMVGQMNALKNSPPAQTAQSAKPVIVPQATVRTPKTTGSVTRRAEPPITYP